MSFLSRFFGSNQREVDRLKPLVREINGFESELEKLSDTELRERFGQLRERVRQDVAAQSPALKGLSEEERSKRLYAIEEEALKGVLTRAFAAVREAGKRVVGMRHFDVQLLGGIVLHQGKIAEMKTGEGKTLVATLPLALNALLEGGTHLVTVNGYLARRDAGWMGPLYHLLGLSVGVIDHDLSLRYDPSAALEGETDERLRHFRVVSRTEAYAADVTYGTNNEFGFDYLRDNMAPDLSRLAQRSFRYGIVDEVDSILIDEARTPLIISAPAEESTALYGQFAQLVPRLKLQEDYKVDEKDRAVTLTDEGIRKMEVMLGVDNIYDARGVAMVHHLEEALKAHALFKRDVDYVVKEGEIVIVDEFTGRMMPGRRFSEGLHQALEAKEGVEVKRESDTLGTISFQNLFRMYPKLGGMTGTAATEAEEFHKIYNLEVVEIPTNREMVRQDRHDQIYKNEEGKFRAVVEAIKERSKEGQPVLVGTISVEKSERLARLLKREGIKYEVLNAKNHHREAKIIENAGKPGAVTVATNMAGRGVDIILGGKMPEDKNSKSDPPAGEAGARNPKLPITNHQSPITKAKKNTSDAWKEWEKDHQKVLELGGLFVIGTERHESRRIDNQLRGRSGRQGDPGMSQFYVSMEDDLMRIFGGDRLKAIMGRLGLPDDQPIEHGLISRSIESAQKKVEGHNFDIRKHLVQYDDVMNKHREVIYRRRRRVLEGKGMLAVGDGEERRTQTVPLHEKIVHLMDDTERPQYEQKMKSYPPEVVQQLERAVYLRAIDVLWIEHLNSMEHMRTGIGLRGYGQHDPLVAYKEEAYRLFKGLVGAIEDEVVQILLRVEIKPVQQQQMAARPLIAQPAIVQRPNPEVAPQAAPIASGQLSVASAEVSKKEELQEAEKLAVDEQRTVEKAEQATAATSESKEKVGDVTITVRKTADGEQKTEGGSQSRESRDELRDEQITPPLNHSYSRPAIEMRGASEALAGGGFASQQGIIEQRLRTVKAKVGRNEPCPCGSGKKFKKCHGR